MKNPIGAMAVAALLVLPPTGEAQTAAKSAIIVGQSYPATGSLAALSGDPLIGIRAMLSEVNAAGGVHGRVVELRQADDGNNAAAAAANVGKLAKEGAVAILMPIGTNAAAGALKAANEANIPLVGPYSGGAFLKDFSPQGFPVRIGFDQEYDRMVAHLFTIGLNRIVFVHNENPGAWAAMAGAKKAIERRDQQMAGSASIKEDNSDVVAKAKAVAALNPNAILLALTNSVASKFIPAYRAAGGSAHLYSFSFLNGRALHKAIGPSATGVVVSQVVPYPWASTLPLTAEYQRAMKKIGQTELSFGSFEGYIGAKVLVEALKRSGESPSPAAVKRALESFGQLDLGGIHVKYSPTDHAGLTFSELSMIKGDGSYSR